MYAVLRGTHRGKFFVFIEEQDNNYCCLTVPDLTKEIIQKEIFDAGIKENILEFVQKLPYKVLVVLEAHYKKLNNNTYGLRNTESINKPHQRAPRHPKDSYLNKR